MTLLYPQIPAPLAQELAAQRRLLTVEAAADLASDDHSDCTFTPTGGSRVARAQLGRLRTLLLERAREFGYPGGGDEDRRTAFDAPAAIVLSEEMQLDPAEAAKPGVWDFLSCVLLSDLVRWRFPGKADGTPIERFSAGRRNTFQRLWWRGFVLRDGKSDRPYHYIEALGEDELVQIMERPFLAGSLNLSRATARELLSAVSRHKALARRTLIREGQKRLRRLASFVSFETVEERELSALVAGVYDAVASVMTKSDGSATPKVNRNARQHDAGAAQQDDGADSEQEYSVRTDTAKTTA